MILQVFLITLLVDVLQAQGLIDNIIDTVFPAMTCDYNCICIKRIDRPYVDVLPYRPVVLIHGILAGSDSLSQLDMRIQEKHPGTQVFNTNCYPRFESLTKLSDQVDRIGEDVLAIGEAFPNGINLIGYSQGGLIARAILQKFPQHNVRTFISLSAPQAGQCGFPVYFLSLYSLPFDTSCESAHNFFYTTIGQKFSIGNMWNDPMHQEYYMEYNEFLPYLNNEKQFLNDLEFTASGLTKLTQLILIGGPDDGVIIPWQSSQFGYYRNNSKIVEAMWERAIYQTDAIGLKTLDEAGNLTVYTVPNIDHLAWHTNTSFIDDYILPHLN